MLIVSILFDGLCPEGAVEWSVDDEGAGDAVADKYFEGGAKKIVRVAGPSWSAVRFTVMDMAGLWYLRRGR